ncbi:uncharacterized protein LOC110176077 isoform X4 [Drosophila serrata]|uniref:uncharacterized protein LOC110176077 isoform X4 n=1 Tax=Drosophila serrata TaxID=7274 RepID=UPI000A1D0AFD|nr:uncharacterized protein LOC110176077 isoform X4 [Drosophila serrata]
MAKKFCFSDYNTTNSAEPKTESGENYSRNRRNQERNIEYSAADAAFEAKLEKLASGIGFIEYYRRHFERHCERAIRKYSLDCEESDEDLPPVDPPASKTRPSSSNKEECKPSLPEKKLFPLMTDKFHSSNSQKYKPIPKEELFSLMRDKKYQPSPAEEKHFPLASDKSQKYQPSPAKETHFPLGSDKKYRPCPDEETHFPLGRYKSQEYRESPSEETHFPLGSDKKYRPCPSEEAHYPLASDKYQKYQQSPSGETHFPLGSDKKYSSCPDEETHFPLGRYKSQKYRESPSEETHFPLGSDKKYRPCPSEEAHYPLTSDKSQKYRGSPSEETDFPLGSDKKYRPCHDEETYFPLGRYKSQEYRERPSAETHFPLGSDKKYRPCPCEEAHFPLASDKKYRASPSEETQGYNGDKYQKYRRSPSEETRAYNEDKSLKYRSSPFEEAHYSLGSDKKYHRSPSEETHFPLGSDKKYRASPSEESQGYREDKKYIRSPSEETRAYTENKSQKYRSSPFEEAHYSLGSDKKYQRSPSEETHFPLGSDKKYRASPSEESQGYNEDKFQKYRRSPSEETRAYNEDKSQKYKASPSDESDYPLASDRKYGPIRSDETRGYNEDKPSRSSSCPTEPPNLSPQEHRQCRWEMERDQKYSRQDKSLPRGNSPRGPSTKLPNQMPFKNPYYHPRKSTHSKSSKSCIDLFLDLESEKSIGPSDTDSLGLTFSCTSFEGHTDRCSRKTYDLNIEMPRIRGGAIPNYPTCTCRRKPSAEPRLKVSHSSRINFRPNGGNAPREVEPKRSSFKWKIFYKEPQIGKDPLLETLLSPRSLNYSKSNRCQNRDQKEAENVRENHEQRHQPEVDLSLLDLPEVLSTSSEEKADHRCSLPVPSLGSSHTFTDIWRKKDIQLGRCETPTGGLYSRVHKLQFKPIDRLDCGFSLKPLFNGSRSETQRRIRYFASQFDRLSSRERMQDTELRFQQLRTLQAESDEEFFKHFREHPPADWPLPTWETKYMCPIGGRSCPPITNETILSHKLMCHLDERGLEVREVFTNDRLLLIFNPRTYSIGRNTCMSVIVYAGVYGDPSMLPGNRFMPTRNRKLPIEFARYPKHLPMFVMVCRNQSTEGGRRDDILTVWVVSVDLPQPVHVLLTVVNRRMDATRSCILQVRPLHRTQDCQKLIESGTQFMQLGEQDLRVLTSNDTEPLYMEINVREYAGTLQRTIRRH